MVPEMFHEQVVSPGGNAGVWMVLFTDATRHEGIAMAPLFAELAGTYGQGRLHFAEVDVATWPELAEHYKVRFTFEPVLVCMASWREPSFCTSHYIRLKLQAGMASCSMLLYSGGDPVLPVFYTFYL